jgi:hypothetical protein
VKIIQKIGPWIVSAALCFVAVEIGGAVVFYWNTNSLVYFNQPKIAATQSAVEPSMKRHLHPYFGFTGPYSYRGSFYKTNNLGFTQVEEPREVPFKPEPNDFVVFVFGGSVAARLVSPAYDGTSLQHAMQKLPQLAGKNVVVYNMAQGPGKQPQQLMELAFLIALGQHIDLVLNLDGAMEFASGMTNFVYGVDPIFPPVDVIGAIGNELAPADDSSAEYYQLAYGVTHARDESKRYALLLDASRSGIAYTKNAIFKAIYDRSLQEKLAAYNQTIAKAKGWEGVRRRMGLDMAVKTSKESIIEDIFDMWIRCSDLMKIMANSKGATYLNIVHPNPYHSKKVLTESERTILNLPESNNIRQASSAGYALIESHPDMLKSRGIVSGMALFDDVPDTIYADNTGHFGKLGETMLANFVTDHVGLRLGSPQNK